MLSNLEIKNQNNKFLNFFKKNNKNKFLFYSNFFSGMTDKNNDYLILLNSKISNSKLIIKIFTKIIQIIKLHLTIFIQELIFNSIRHNFLDGKKR